MKRKFRHPDSKRGVTILAAIVIIAVFAIFGLGFITFVSTGHKERIHQITGEQSCYFTLGAIEYAQKRLRAGQQVAGTYDIGNSSVGGGGTVKIEVVGNTVTATGTREEAECKFSAEIPVVPGGDAACMDVDCSQAYIPSHDEDEIHGVILTNTCDDAITFENMQVSWSCCEEDDDDDDHNDNGHHGYIHDGYLDGNNGNTRLILAPFFQCIAQYAPLIPNAYATGGHDDDDDHGHGHGHGSPTPTPTPSPTPTPTPTPDASGCFRLLKKIKVDNTTIFSGTAASGSTLDVVDTTLPPLTPRHLKTKFNNDIDGVFSSVTWAFLFPDGSSALCTKNFDCACGVCEGKVTKLTLKYLGSINNADIEVKAKKGSLVETVFTGSVDPGDEFSFVGLNTGPPSFQGTLGTEIRIYVDGNLHTTIHTSCSQPIGIGQVSGDFMITAGESKLGGPLCPFDGGEPTPTPTPSPTPTPTLTPTPTPTPEECGECEGKVTKLTLKYLGSINDAHVVVKAKKGSLIETVFSGTVDPGDEFSFVGLNTGSPGFQGTLGTEIRIYIGWHLHTTIHTSCSQPIGIGQVSGDFMITAGESRFGGPLCLFEDGEPTPTPSPTPTPTPTPSPTPTPTPTPQACWQILTNQAQLYSSNKKIKKIYIDNDCDYDVYVNKATTSWTPNFPTRKLEEIEIDNTEVFDGSVNSGVEVTLHPQEKIKKHKEDEVKLEFSANMGTDKIYTLTIKMTDSSENTVQFSFQ